MNTTQCLALIEAIENIRSAVSEASVCIPGFPERCTTRLRNASYALGALSGELSKETAPQPTPCAAPVAQRFLIWSHEHHAWWAPHRHGYTFSREDAGRYSQEEAFGIVRSANAACKPGVVEESLVPE